MHAADTGINQGFLFLSVKAQGGLLTHIGTCRATQQPKNVGSGAANPVQAGLTGALLHSICTV